jgi:hypothetical protein
MMAAVFKFELVWALLEEGRDESKSNGKMTKKGK